MEALDGILVVAIEQAVSAPLCTQRLCDAGARVIKVERPEGDFARSYDHVVDGDSAYFLWLNRGKESIALDFRQAADAALLQAMLARADIFVQNLAPGAAERAGFGSEQLRDRFPALITCDITGYDKDGPWRNKKAYDLLIQCEAVKRLEAAGIGRADVNEIADLSTHPALRRTMAAGSAGPVGLPSSPMDRARECEPMTMPALDSHDADIRKEFA